MISLAENISMSLTMELHVMEQKYIGAKKVDSKVIFINQDISILMS